ncbi:MAG: hypothetical protein AAF740_07745, partial [Bacteroidota bacterium]
MKKQFFLSCIFLLFPRLLFAQCIPAGDRTITAPNTLVSTYFPASASATADTDVLTVDASARRGEAQDIVDGDLLLIIQMQGVQINTAMPAFPIANCTDYTYPLEYGDGAGGSDRQGFLNNINYIAGRYEYVIADGDQAGNTINIRTPLINSYEQSTTPTNTTATTGIGGRTFQVIRVGNYRDLVVQNGASITAPKWNGSTGGIVAIDVNTLLTFNTGAGDIAIDVDGLGFRGGYRSSSFQDNSTDPWNSVPGNGNQPGGDRDDVNNDDWQPGYRGEGIAGSPQWMWDIDGRVGGATTSYPGIRAEVYPENCSGIRLRNVDADAGFGAPGNAGGSAVEDMGGGGGGNSGFGGDGSYAASTYRTGPVSKGGGAITDNETQNGIRLFMGGGGGSGGWDDDTNDTDQAGSGQPGGGVILIRANDITGQGILTADGLGGFAQTSEAAGGGGAGGTILISTGQTNLTLTIRAKGGDGNTSQGTSGDGGGGGGGRIVLYNLSGSATVTTISTDVTQGDPGLSDAGVVAAGAGAGGVSSGEAPSFAFIPFECDQTILPVELIKFEGEFLSHKSVVELRWETASEEKNEYFFVERSEDGTKWETITKVRGAGNSDTRQKYIYKDPDVLASPVYYYRLMQRDYTGNKEYFKAIAIYTRNTDASLAENLQVYPNPATNHVTLNGFSGELKVSIH